MNPFAQVWSAARDGWTRLRAEEPEDARPSEAETVALIEEVATWVVKRRLETPALLFLEAHKPFSFLAGQALVVGTPFLAPLFGTRRTEITARLLDTPDFADRLADRIERLADEALAPRRSPAPSDAPPMPSSPGDSP